MKMELIFGFICLAAVFFSCSGRRPASLGVLKGKLFPCPESPNCVSSQSEEKSHYIEPITYEGDRDSARDSIIAVIKKMKRAKVIVENGDYIHAEFRSALFRFVDDVEFFFPGDKKVIHIRSASRIGYSDMGVNRKRVEEIRSLFSGKRN